MMRKIKRWLIDVFFPRWANESIIQDNKRLRLQNNELRAKIDHLNAYIDGLEDGIRTQRRIVINNGRLDK